MTHICIRKLTIIASDNGLSPDHCRAIIWTNAGINLIQSIGTMFYSRKCNRKCRLRNGGNLVLALISEVAHWQNITSWNSVLFTESKWRKTRAKLIPQWLVLGGKPLFMTQCCFLFLTGSMRTNFNIVWNKIHRFSFTKWILNIPSVKMATILFH